MLISTKIGMLILPILILGVGCSEVSDPAKTEERTLISPTVIVDGMDSYTVPNDKKVCNEIINTDPPNTTILYSNTDKKISIELPFNSSWGSENYTVPPYDVVISGGYERVIGEKVEFGPVEISDPSYSCLWNRNSWLSFNKQASAEDVIKEMTKGGVYGLEILPNKVMVDGKKVVKYKNLFAGSFPGTAGWCAYEVIGKSYNYRIGTFCTGENNDPAFESLDKIVKTMKID